MWTFFEYETYLTAVSDLMDHPAVRAMERLPQHAEGFSCFHHSVWVSYWSWRVCLWMGLDACAAARGGLLHDLYLYDWTSQKAPNGKWHGTEHPRTALKNAQTFFSLSEKERDIIVKHMWPLTLRPYRYLESLVVSCVDKVCAVAELLRLHPDPTAFQSQPEPRFRPVPRTRAA